MHNNMINNSRSEGVDSVSGLELLPLLTFPLIHSPIHSLLSFFPFAVGYLSFGAYLFACISSTRGRSRSFSLFLFFYPCSSLSFFTVIVLGLS